MFAKILANSRGKTYLYVCVYQLGEISFVQCPVLCGQCPMFRVDHPEFSVMCSVLCLMPEKLSPVFSVQYYMSSFQLDSSVRSSVSNVPCPLSRVLCHVSYGLCPSCVLFAVFCVQCYVQTFQLSSRVQCPVSIVPFPLSRCLCDVSRALSLVPSVLCSVLCQVSCVYFPVRLQYPVFSVLCPLFRVHCPELFAMYPVLCVLFPVYCFQCCVQYHVSTLQLGSSVQCPMFRVHCPEFWCLVLQVLHVVYCVQGARLISFTYSPGTRVLCKCVTHALYSVYVDY